MYRTVLSRELINQVDRLQRELGAALDVNAPSIRSLGYPPLNVGLRPESVEVYAFAPGLDPASIRVDLDRGVLSIAAERPRTLPERNDEKVTLHQAERFAGRFRRVVNLPDDIDPDSVNARYRDGVLQVSVARRAAAPARRIDVR